MAVWILLLVIALICGVKFDSTLIFWVGVLSLWVMSKGSNGSNR